jgi:hypothetical protein
MQFTRIPTQSYGLKSRATALTFFDVKIPLQAVYFEEKIHRKVAKVKKGRENEALYRNLFALFAFVVKNSFKTR